MVENAAAPVTAIAIGPLTEVVFMPLMTDGFGADWIGSWFGTGSERGIAAVFTPAGVIGVIVTLLALGSRTYRKLTTLPAGDLPHHHGGDADSGPRPRPALATAKDPRRTHPRRPAPRDSRGAGQ